VARQEWQGWAEWGLAGRGLAWQEGEAMQGEAMRGVALARRGAAGWLGPARRRSAWNGRSGRARRGEAKRCEARRGNARQEWHGAAGPGRVIA